MLKGVIKQRGISVRVALDLLDEVKAVEIRLDGQCLDHISRMSPAVRSISQALDAMPTQRTLLREV